MCKKNFVVKTAAFLGGALVCAALFFGSDSYAATTRTLTEQELTAVTTYLEQQQVELENKWAKQVLNWDPRSLPGPNSAWAKRMTERGLSQAQMEAEAKKVPEAQKERDEKDLRNPLSLIQKWERYKYDNVKQRWNARPEFPGWQDSCYRWEAGGSSYQSQLFCSKCGKWVNPTGFSCLGKHPLSFMENWQFCVTLIAKTYNKPMEAKAHLWNALQHKELTEEQWDRLMAMIDAIEAEPATLKVEAEAKVNAAADAKAERRAKVQAIIDANRIAGEKVKSDAALKAAGNTGTKDQKESQNTTSLSE